MKKKLIIHIGYPKTATTTFQKQLFARHEQIGYIDHLDFSYQLRKALYFERELSFMKNIDIYKNELNNIIYNVKDKDIIIYSNEAILSYSMFYSFEPYPNIRSIDPCSIARKVKNLFNNLEYDIKIMMTIRKQDSIIRSLYTQVYNQVFSKFSKTRTFSNFLIFINENKNDLVYDSLDYYMMADYYSSLFDRSNIKIFVYEELVDNPNIFWTNVFSWLNIKNINIVARDNIRSLGNSTYKTDDRKLNDLLFLFKQKYFPTLKIHKKVPIINKLANFTVKGKKIKINYSEEEQEKIFYYFRNNNLKLESKYKLNLEKYGYC